MQPHGSRSKFRLWKQPAEPLWGTAKSLRAITAAAAAAEPLWTAAAAAEPLWAIAAAGSIWSTTDSLPGPTESLWAGSEPVWSTRLWSPDGTTTAGRSNQAVATAIYK